MVSHDPEAASYADRVVFLADGRIVHETISPTAEEMCSSSSRRPLRPATGIPP